MPVLCESIKIREIIGIGMFQYKKSLRRQQIVCFNFFDKKSHVSHIIGGVGKNDVEFTGTYFKKFMHTHAYKLHVVYIKKRYVCFNKINAFKIIFYTNKLFNTSRNKLVRDTSCACEKVEDNNIVKINFVIYDIEQTFFGKVGGGAYMYMRWQGNFTSFVISAYYSQFKGLINYKNNERASHPIYMLYVQVFR